MTVDITCRKGVHSMYRGQHVQEMNVGGMAVGITVNLLTHKWWLPTFPNLQQNHYKKNGHSNTGVTKTNVPIGRFILTTYSCENFFRLPITFLLAKLVTGTNREGQSTGGQKGG